MRLFSHDDPRHLEAFELLPWVASDALDSDERARVERHVSVCIACKRELTALKNLQVAIQADEDDIGYKRDLARVMSRIDDTEQGPAAWFRRLGKVSRGGALAGALLAPWALVALLAVVVFRDDPLRYYHVLSAPAQVSAGHGNLVVIFRPDQPEQSVRELLLRLHARITDGPTPEGAYVIALADGERQSALSRLRGDPAVVFAEPVPQTGVVRQ